MSMPPQGQPRCPKSGHQNSDFAEKSSKKWKSPENNIHRFPTPLKKENRGKLVMKDQTSLTESNSPLMRRPVGYAQ
jgi:hypothetical protein